MKLKLGMLLLATVPLMSACDIEVDGIQETYDYYVVDAYTGEVTAESML